jgi:hypothetical protein
MIPPHRSAAQPAAAKGTAGRAARQGDNKSNRENGKGTYHLLVIMLSIGKPVQLVHDQQLTSVEREQR